MTDLDLDERKMGEFAGQLRGVLVGGASTQLTHTECVPATPIHALVAGRP